MGFVQWMVLNWQSVLSILSLLLASGVIIAHLAHKESVAVTLQGIEDALNKVNGGPKPPAA